MKADTEKNPLFEIRQEFSFDNKMTIIKIVILTPSVHEAIMRTCLKHHKRAAPATRKPDSYVNQRPHLDYQQRQERLL